MSAAAAVAPRRAPTRGYVQIPNSLIENQALFTHAELALTLIVLRRGGVGESPVTVSDRNWQSWTGLSPRLKEYAISGLRLKCITATGRGESLRISFMPSAWDKFVRNGDRAKPRTAGRKAVSPKPGAKIHPDCRDRGCALLAAENGLTAVAPTPNAQPVARPCAGGQVDFTVNGDRGLKLVTAVLPTPNAQPVARIADAAEQLWGKTLDALRAAFPIVGLLFLVRLLSVVRAMFSDVQDGELAEAVSVAWRNKRGKQTSEGLFLLTVPEALAAIRRRPAPVSPPDLPGGVGRLLVRVADVLRDRGSPFGIHAAAAQQLAARAVDAKTGADLFAVEAAMQNLEGQIVEAAAGRMTDAEREGVARAVAAELEPYRARLDQARQSQFEAQSRARHILHWLGVPRLGTFYV